MSEELRAWLSEELERRHWSHRELARRVGLSQGLVSQTLAGDRSPSNNFCLKVAQALGEAPEKLFRLAGILPPSEDDPTITELNDMIRNMTPEQRKDMLKYARYLYRDEG